MVRITDENRTTIPISKETRDLLIDLKGKKSYDDFICECIDKSGVDIPVDEVGGDRVALSIVCEDRVFNTGGDYQITFSEVKNSEVGKLFTVPFEIKGRFFYKETAKVLFVDDVSAVVRVNCKDVTSNYNSEDSKLVHIVFY